jgi:signal transduction histidine kinase
VILTEKMASLGQVVAGVAHEINTPSSAIAAALSNMKGYLDSLAVEIPALLSTGLPEAAREPFFGLVTTALAPDPRRGQPSTAEVRERSRVLEAALTGRGPRRPRETAVTFSRLGLHSEIASLLSAPDAQLLPQAALDFLDTVGNLGLAVNDTNLSVDAITRMVKALRSYSHPDRTEMAEADLHDGLETTLTILRSQMKYGVVVERRYSRLPPVLCNVNELNQVWTNLIHNAVQAMRGVGKILIETAESNGSVAVRITDTGPGIPDSLRSRVFDPFFTTKDQGEGTGLGLGIAQQIVRRHGGSITFESQPGRTTFEVLLPLRHPARESAS